MPYELGIDFGTTYTAASTSRSGRVEAAHLGDRAAAVPTLLFALDDGGWLVGDAAYRRALDHPSQLAREFKRRIGDPIPIILGGCPYSADALAAVLLARVVEIVTGQQGEAPAAITLTHPANWGPFKLDLLRQAAERGGLGDVTLLAEPEAAALCYAGSERIQPGTTVAVYDLGGGTFDAALLRRTENGFALLGHPYGIERLGGIDFDEAIFAHVAKAVDGALDELDPAEPASIAAVARLRVACVEAKENLSADTETSIAVMLPGDHTTVRLTRAEFEKMIQPSIEDTIASLRRTLASADLEPADLDRVLLVGGSSRIPLVAELISAELGRPVVADTHPTHAVSNGAALGAAPSGAASTTSRPAGVAPAPRPPSDGTTISTPAVQRPARPAPVPKPAAPMPAAPPNQQPAGQRPPASQPAGPQPAGPLAGPRVAAYRSPPRPRSAGPALAVDPDPPRLAVAPIAAQWLAPSDPVRRRSRRALIAGAALAAVAVLVVVAIVALGRSKGQDKTNALDSTASQTTTAAAPLTLTPEPSDAAVVPPAAANHSTRLDHTTRPVTPTPTRPASPTVPPFPAQLVGAWAGPADLAGIPVTVKATVAAVARGQSIGPYSVQMGAATCHFTTALVDYGTDFVSFAARGGEQGCADGRVSLRFSSPGVANYSWAGPPGASSTGVLRHG